MPKYKKILVTTSTFPRWKNDATPPFVAHFCETIAPHFQKVYVAAPHAKGASTKESQGPISVRRYRYFFPASQEDIVYGGGGVGKIKKTPMYAVKLLCLIGSQFLTTLGTVVFKRAKIVNAHWIIPQGFTAILTKFLTGAKVVVTVHGSDIFTLNGSTMVKIKRFILKHADAVVANSGATLAACQAVCPSAKYHVVPMGIDLNRFHNLAKSAELVSKYGLGDFTILFVGRLSEEKGVVYLLDALKELKDANVSFKALIVGDGSSRQQLEEWARQNNLGDSVVFVGWVSADDIVSYYATADVFVGPSLREAQGLVFAEALATGLPAVASNVGGIPDIVIDGQTGFLVPPKSSTAIAQKLSLLHDDPALREHLAQNGRQHVGQSYSWQSVGERYAAIFAQL